MDKEEERAPKLPEFQCRVFGGDPVAERPAAAAATSSSAVAAIARAPACAPNRNR
jgi:hypothetical protein